MNDTFMSSDDFRRDRKKHAAFVKMKSALFEGDRAEADELIQAALSEPVTIIRKDAGSGRRILLCHIAEELQKSGFTVLPFITGLTPESESAKYIIESTVCFLEDELHLEHYTDETDPPTGEKKERSADEWVNRLNEMCSAYEQTGAKLLIMVEGADRLTPGEERNNLFFMPLFASKNIHFVMSGGEDFLTPGSEEDYMYRPSAKPASHPLKWILPPDTR